MSVETSNAPREVWVTLTDRGELIEVWEMEDAARHPVLRYGVERYLRADQVALSADEIARELAPHVLYGVRGEDLMAAAEAVRSLLLSRIEGEGR